MDITAAEAARRLGVTRQRAVVLAHSGRFAGAWQTEAGREWRIPEQAVASMKREREAAAQTTN